MSKIEYQEIDSPNFDNRTNEVNYPKFVIIHYTAENFISTKRTFTNPNTKVSAHYVIDTDGKVYIFVPEEKRAWHAGFSYFDGVGHNLLTRRKIYGDMNSASIGIELVNPGYEKEKQPISFVVNYTKNQIYSLRILVSDIVAKYSIPPKYVLGHSDVAPNRKIDPGFYFPWKDLTDHKTNKRLAIWVEDEIIEKQDPEKLDTDDKVSKAFKYYGYSVASPQHLVYTKSAFQERYNPTAWINNKKFGDEDKKRLLALLAS